MMFVRKLPQQYLWLTLVNAFGGGGGGGLLSYSHQTHYIYCSHQLSNLHSLATTNRKPAILFVCGVLEKKML